jgi:predicted dehydrogenase
MDLRIGVMGFGGMGHYHAEHVKVPGVTFVTACDIEAVQLADAEALGVKAYLNDEEGFFNDGAINTVLLTVPNHLHKEYAVKAAKAGKNVICEKPAALLPADLDEMTQAAEEHGVLFEVHQNRRWDRDFRIVKKIYDEKLIGEIFNIESNIHMPSGRVHGWHQFKEYGGGMVYDWGVHCIDQALRLIPDKVDTVFADLKSVFHTEVDDHYKIMIKFRGGQTVNLNLSTYVLKPYPRWFVCGDKGTAEVLSFAGDGKLYKTSRVLEKLPPRIEPNAAGPTRSYIPVPPGELLEEDLPDVPEAAETAWLEFYRNYHAVLNGKETFKIRNEEVRRVLELIQAVFKSAETGMAVRFDYDD